MENHEDGDGEIAGELEPVLGLWWLRIHWRRETRFSKWGFFWGGVFDLESGGSKLKEWRFYGTKEI